MNRIRHRIKSIFENESGLTLVEVITAFVILLIGLAGLTQATSFSQTLSRNAVTIQHGIDDLVSDYNGGTFSPQAGNGHAVKTEESSSLKLEFDDGTACTIPGNLNTYTKEINGRQYSLHDYSRSN